MAFQFVSAYAQNGTPFYVSGATSGTPQLVEAPQQLTLRFSPGVKIDPASLNAPNAISMIRSGGATDGFGATGSVVDVPIVPGSVTVDDTPNGNQVIVRFAETLPDDTYQITIGAGLQSTNSGSLAAPATFQMRLNLGAYVVSVVPQPVSRDPGTGLLSQARNTVEVYFNSNDPLDQAKAETASFYRLVQVNAATGADVGAAANPTGVAYDQTAGKAVLTFAAGVIADDRLFRLEIGGNASVAAAGAVAEAADSTNSRFFQSQDLGTLGAAGATVNGAIDVRPTVTTSIGSLGYPSQPGTIDSPGHRDTPVDSGSHVSPFATVDPATGITVIPYNFQDHYGDDPQGNPLHNVITETQKQRAREIFELYSLYAGVRFVETADQGLTVATGDLRAFAPDDPPTPAGLGGGSGALMNSLYDWGQSEYGGGWFIVAMHEIGHALGLPHSYDVPSIMGSGVPDAVYPGNYDIEHVRQLAGMAPTSNDVDIYKFNLTEAGTVTAQTFVARPGEAVRSRVDTVVSLYRQDAVTGQRTLIARNDNYYGRDSFVRIDLEPGTYYVAVTSTGNTDINPDVPDSGSGGRTGGAYQLKVDFAPATAAANTILDTTGTPLDGDRDGAAGGAFKFWFNTASTAKTLYVDKANPGAGTGNGSLGNPYKTISAAVAAANAVAGTANAIRVIRIAGNTAGTNGAPLPYLIGVNAYGQALSDGATFNVPAGVTVMVDAGAVFKLGAAIIDVGSSSELVNRAGAALQVLGTPAASTVFTSLYDDTIGGISDGFAANTGPAVASGQWGGVVLRADSDAASQAAFVNSIAGATFRYGGGKVRVDGNLQNFASIQLEDTRPTVVFNSVTDSGGAAIAATPNSFKDTTDRVGPEFRGNRLTGNSINGLFLKIDTEFGTPLEKLDVPARFRSTDIVYVIQENFVITGGAGGYIIGTDGIERARQSGRLTIDPGAIVKLQGARIELERGISQLIAEGTAYEPVIFTSFGDNRYGAGGTFDTNGVRVDKFQVVNGFSNGVANGTLSTGDWGGIVLNAGSIGSIDHAYIAFGGGQTPIEGTFDSFNVIETHQGDLRLANSRVEYNAAGAASTSRTGRGTNAAATVFVNGAQPIIVGNDFRQNAGAVVSINANSLSDLSRPDAGRSTGSIDRFPQYDDNLGALVRGNRLSYTPTAGLSAIAGMVVRGSEITVEGVWDDTDMVHVLQNEIIVQNFHTATGMRLVSRPDASLVVKLDGATAGFTAAGFPLDIDDRIGGTVQVVGQAGYPVVLTSLKDDTVGASLDPLGQTVKDTNVDGAATTPAAGDWRSLQFQSYSNDRNVAVVSETEKPLTGGIDANATPDAAQWLGVLAPNYPTGTASFDSAQEKSGDENRRLGFEVHGQIAPDAPGDVDVYSFTGYAGSTAWIDIDKTAGSLDAMVELLDASGRVLARSVDVEAEGGVIQAEQVSSGGGSSVTYQFDHGGLLAGTLVGTLYDDADPLNPVAIQTFSFDSTGAVYFHNTMGTDPQGAPIALTAAAIGATLNLATGSLTLDFNGGGIGANHVEVRYAYKTAAFSPTTLGIAQPLGQSAVNGGDFYSLNPRDPGMCVVLPGTQGTRTQYFIRVRSQKAYDAVPTQSQYEADLRNEALVQDGATAGRYELRVRLQQRDEKPGSTVVYADIRYPTTGIDVQGLPRSSLLVGEIGESANRGFALSNFANAANLSLNGDAQIVGNVLQLTPAQASTASAVWYPTQQYFQGGFETKFDFKISNIGLDGADGLAFVIQGMGPNALGGFGGGMGYQGITRSLAVEFDTFPNGAPEPDVDHVSIQSRGINPNTSAHVFSLASNANISALSDGQVHQVVIRYSGGTLSVFLDDLTNPAVTCQIDLATYLGITDGQAWVGLTSGTGTAGWEQHDILNWSYAPLGDVPADAGGTFANAQYIGNVLQSDKNAISVAGTTANADDIDWYTFAVNYEKIQAIPGINDKGQTFAAMFDIDYADGFRGDLQFAVFDEQGTLMYVSRDSNVANDQPVAGQGNNFADLARASLGKLDPMLGTVTLDAGVPDGVTGVENPTVPPNAAPATQVRYYVAVFSNKKLPEQLDAMFNAGSGNVAVRLAPISSVAPIVSDDLNPPGTNVVTEARKVIDFTNLAAHVTPFTLSDVTLFVTTGTSLVTADAMRGGLETTVSATLGSGDIVMRSDGRLYGYRGLAGAANTAGTLDLIDSGTGTRTNIGNDNIPDLVVATTPTVTQINLSPQQVGVLATSTFQLANGNLVPGTITGTVQYTGTVGGVVTTGTWTFTSDAGGTLAITAVVEPAGLAKPQSGTVNATTGVVSVTWSTPVAMTGVSLVTTTYTYTVPGNPNSVTTDLVDALAWNWTSVGGVNALYYSVRDAAQSRLYPANTTTGVAGNRIGTFIQNAGGTLGITTGMAFVNGTLYGVDDRGHFYTINTGTAVATIIKTITGAPVFAGLTRGPQNLEGGRFQNLLFGITSGGDLYCFDTAGNLQTVFDSNGDGIADATTIATNVAGATGLAFSPLDINLWHNTSKRSDEGDGSANYSSMYFGLENRDNPQFGASAAWQADLLSNPAIRNNYNLPGGAYGSLTTDTFSLAGYDYTDKPTLYFSYWLQTEGANSKTDMRDSARAFVSIDGGLTWEVVATNNSIRSLPNGTDAELPNFASVSSRITGVDPLAPGGKPFNQKVQELYETSNWRQARIDLGEFAGQADVRLRFDFSTAGVMDATERNADGNLLNDIVDNALSPGGAGVANTDGTFADGTVASAGRGLNNQFEGFYIDRIIVGCAERGEQVTNAVAAKTDLTDLTMPDKPAQVLSGAYQFEIRRGSEQGVVMTLPDGTDLLETFNTNDPLDPSRRTNSDFGPKVGDPNQPRQQGQVIIQSNIISNAQTYGISIDAASRDVNTGAPTPGVPVNFATLNGSRLVPGVVVMNNVVAGSGAGGILFSGDPNTGSVALAAVPFGRIVNNTVYGGGTVLNLQGATTTSSTTVTLASTVGLRNGWRVSGPGIPVGATIAAVLSNTQVQLSVSATATAAAVALRFAEPSVDSTGVVVSENAGPTLLNNIFANLAQGVRIDATSSANTVVGMSAYWNTATQVTGVTESGQLTLAADPFVNAAARNFYLVEGSRAIDSAINSLQDRANYVVVTSPLGIPASPILAPDRDLYGQLRGDDLAVAPPSPTEVPGLGKDVYKDRGAIDRVDFTQPWITLANPLDQASTDLERAPDAVRLAVADAQGVTQFTLQLNDVGVGIDKSTVTSAAFALARNGGAPLVDGTDYLFRYLESSNQVVFEAASVYAFGTYEIRVKQVTVGGTSVNMIADLAGNRLLPNNGDGTTSFTIALADVPGAPGKPVGTPAVGQVALAWTMPGSDGGSAITDYVVQYKVNGQPDSAYVTFADGTSTATSATVAPLVNGTAYVFRVAAKNAIGPGAWSQASDPVKPGVVPGVPTGLAVTSKASGQVTLGWTAPVVLGSPALSDYVVEYKVSGQPDSTYVTFADAVSTATSATVTGLVNGTAYVFRVKARNDIGDSGYAVLGTSEVVGVLPGAPTGLGGVATAATRSVALSWTAPAVLGSPGLYDYVIQYKVSGQPDSAYVTFNDGVSTATAATVTGLASNTTYVFRVRAVNVVGAGDWTSATATVLMPATVPTAPQNLVASAVASGAVALTWSAPADNGGSPISDYVVQYKVNGQPDSAYVTFADAVSTATSASVSGLVNGTSYVFRVAAKNAIGNGPWSLVSNAVTPQQLASAPTRLTGTAGNGSVALAWTAPTITGGLPIVSYAIQYSTNSVNWLPLVNTGSSLARATVSVPNGVTYVFRVAAVTAAGTGAFSAASPAVTPYSPTAVPMAPTNLIVTNPATRTARLSWTAPPANAGGPITGYVVQYRLATSSTWVSIAIGSPTTSATIQNLTAGASYVFRVQARNLAGLGAFSAQQTLRIA